MVAPKEFQRMPIEVKWNLESYRAWLDCRTALDIIKSKDLRFIEWRIEWVGLCALLRTSVYLIGMKDAKSCLPDRLRNQLKRNWKALRENKEAYPIFNEFIYKERNNILK